MNTVKNNHNNEILINPCDYKSLLTLMNESEKYPNMLIGENERGETIWASILSNRIEIQTFQNNNWIRHNIYWKNGITEEMYEK